MRPAKLAGIPQSATPNKDIKQVAQGEVNLDALTHKFIHAHLAFRWVETPDGKTAHEVERLILRGEWAHGAPLLNSPR